MPSYPGISSEAFIHPLDREAEQTLRRVPGFEILSRSFVEFLYERPQHVYLLGNAIQASPRQYSTIYGIARECIRDLDVVPEPLLFVSQNAQANSYSLGREQPHIILNTGLLDLLEEQEIRTIIARELGHIKCEHTTLRQMSLWAMNAASMLGDMTLGLGNLLSSGLLYAFYEWRHKAELSADRAALLVIDDLPTILKTMMKLAGGSAKYAQEISLAEFIRQGKNYQELDRDSFKEIYKFLLYNGGNNSFLTHPFPVERIHYLEEWSTSPEYNRLRQGSYQSGKSPGSVEENDKASEDEVSRLQEQIERLKAEIHKVKSQGR
ncbi:MAG: M48 family metallopeptidase [Spirulinaceae cyanobacterium]